MNDKLKIMDPDAVEGIYREGWSDGADFDGDFAKTADDQTAAATEAWEASHARKMYASSRPRTEPLAEDGGDKPSPGPWEAHDDDGTGTLPCVLSEHVNPSGTFYVAQCNRFADAKLTAAAPDLADACEALLDRLQKYDPNHTAAFLKVPAVKLATAALRKAGRLS